MNLLTTVAAFIGILTGAIGYGTDVFEALVQRPALTLVDDTAVAAVMGRVHEYGDKRLPIPGCIAIGATALATLSAAIDGSTGRATAAGVALIALLVWSALYFRIAAPINRVLTAAAQAHTTPTNTRDLQERWDSIITGRALLMTTAIVGLALTAILR